LSEQLAHHQDHYNQFEPLLKAFAQAGERSTRLLDGHGLASVSPRSPYEECVDFDPLPTQGHFEIMKLDSPGVARRTLACDTSVVKLAEAIQGSVWALRGCIVRRETDRLSIEVVGPFVCALSRETLPYVIKSLLSGYETCRTQTPSLNMAHHVVANLFEKRLQLYAASKLDGGILLADGSLTASPRDSPLSLVREVIEMARTQGQGVLAFAKSSRLRLMGYRITSMLLSHRPPYLVRFPQGLRLRSGHVQLGEILVANLSHTLSFRLDAAPREGIGPDELVQDLMSSDALIYGYPETLILAHQFATFNAMDILGLRARLESMLDAQLTTHLDARELLFAPLDRG